MWVGTWWHRWRDPGSAGSDGQEVETRVAEKGISEATGLTIRQEHDCCDRITPWFIEFEQMDDLLGGLEWGC